MDKITQTYQIISYSLIAEDIVVSPHAYPSN